jgi:hypothetical protein
MGESMILGVSGTKQSGKSSLAEFIKAWYEVDNRPELDKSRFVVRENGKVVWIENPLFNFQKVKVYSFADSLKDFCIDTLGLESKQCWGTDDEKNTETPYLWDNLPEEIRKKYGTEEKEEAFGFRDGIWEKVERKGRMTGREVMQVLGTDIARDMFDQNIWVNATLRKIRKENYDLALIADVRFPSEVKAVTENNGYVIRLTRTYDASDKHSSETALDDYSWKQHGNQVMLLDNTGKTIYHKNEVALQFIKSVMCGA